MAPPKRTTSRQNQNESIESPGEILAAISTLTDHLKILTSAIDDLREEVGWVLRNAGEPPKVPERCHVVSMPLDPAAEDFHQRVNAVSHEQVAELRRAAPALIKS